MMFLKPETMTAVPAAPSLKRAHTIHHELSQLFVLYATIAQTGYIVPTSGTGLADSLTNPAIANVPHFSHSYMGEELEFAIKLHP
jgi:hypothetical protein